jgi:cytoskeletal protein RodZ
LHWSLVDVKFASTVEKIPDQIGERLVRAREKAGLTVEDVEFRTRIPHTVIEALEAADFSVFSSPTYAKSFLAQYSDFLNVEAGVWLDALQPASFVADELVSPLWIPTSAAKEERPPDHAVANGWFSAIILLVVTCGLVLAAMKGYAYLEARLDKEPKRHEETQESGKIPAPENPPKPAESLEPMAKKPEDELAQPPPRAIIVR